MRGIKRGHVLPHRASRNIAYPNKEKPNNNKHNEENTCYSNLTKRCYLFQLMDANLDLLPRDISLLSVNFRSLGSDLEMKRYDERQRSMVEERLCIKIRLFIHELFEHVRFKSVALLKLEMNPFPMSKETYKRL